VLGTARGAVGRERNAGGVGVRGHLTTASTPISPARTAMPNPM